MFVKTYRSIVNFLKKKCSPLYPISVRRLKLNQQLDGDCQLKNDKFIIRINKNLSEEHSIDVLLHEMAHVMSWDSELQIHGPKWGIAYSKIYRLFEKEYLEKESRT